MKMKTLITGVGGDLGQALCKALRISKNSQYEIYGVDTKGDGIGFKFVDHFFKVPISSDLEYLGRIDSICRENQIKVIVPGSEAELLKLSEVCKNQELPCGAKLIALKPAVIELFADKLICYRHLSKSLEVPAFCDPTNPDELQRFLKQNPYPLLLKERRSSGSKNLYKIEEHSDLLFYLKKMKSPVLQEWFDDAQGEFSIGLFVSGDITHHVTFFRTLGPVGCSWYAHLVQDKEIDSYIRNFAEKIKVEGSLNIQLRKSSNGIKLLEINPRFSSLVAARAAVGFCDLEWAIGQSLDLPVPKQINLLSKFKFQRYFAEVIDQAGGYESLDAWRI